jgi:hypothetical protein
MEKDSEQKPIQLTVDGEGFDDVCVANISPRERRKRLAGGVIALIMSLVALVVLVWLGVDRWWRLILFPIFYGAAVGFFQWRDQT